MPELRLIAHWTADVGNLTRILARRSDATFGDATRSTVLAPASHASIGFDPRGVHVLHVKTIVQAT